MARTKGRGRGRPRGSTSGATPAPTSTGRPRGRPRKNKMVIDSDEDHEQMETSDIEEKHTTTDTVEEEESSTVEDTTTAEESTTEQSAKDNSVEFNIDDDISQLVPPTFSTISKGPPQPMLELSWDHQYVPMGEKVASPNIHMCISCRLPIRLYGRLIPCKHIFCHTCAVKQGDRCSCCDDRVSRVEKAPLGSVFMCLQGGVQYSYDGCRRTYLSQRDLQSHVDHRHKPRASGGSSGSSAQSSRETGKSSSSSTHDTNSSRSNDIQSPVHSNASSTPSSHRQSIPVHFSSSRSNLISVPLQSGPSSGGSNSRNPKEPHADNRYDRKSGSSSSSSSYSRNSSTSGWGNFRPY